jgi:hypothetical protein
MNVRFQTQGQRLWRYADQQLLAGRLADVQLDAAAFRAALKEIRQLIKISTPVYLNTE